MGKSGFYIIIIIIIIIIVIVVIIIIIIVIMVVNIGANQHASGRASGIFLEPIQKLADPKRACKYLRLAGGPSYQ